MENEKGIPPLDLSVIKQQDCLEPVANAFSDWYKKYSHKMGEVERTECQWALDHLTASWTGLISPHDNYLFQKYLGCGHHDGTARDLVFGVFHLLRLLYITFHDEVLKRHVEANGKPPQDASDTGRKFTTSSLVKLVRERYGDGIDIEEFPGAAPPRPKRWPPLGQRLLVLTKRRRADTEEGNKTGLRKDKNDIDDDSDYTPTTFAHLRRSKRRRIVLSETPQGSEFDEETQGGQDFSDLFTEGAESGLERPNPEVNNSGLNGNKVGLSSEPRVQSTEASNSTSNSVEDTGTTTTRSPRGREIPASTQENKTNAPQVSVHSLASLPPVLSSQDGIHNGGPRQPMLQQLSNLRNEIKNIHQREDQTFFEQKRLYEAFVQYSKPLNADSRLVEKVESLSVEVEDLRGIIKEQNITIDTMSKERESVSNEMQDLRDRCKDQERNFADLTISLEAHFPMLKLDKPLS